MKGKLGEQDRYSFNIEDNKQNTNLDYPRPFVRAAFCALTYRQIWIFFLSDEIMLSIADLHNGMVRMCSSPQCLMWD